MSSEWLRVAALNAPGALLLPRPPKKARFSFLYSKAALYQAALKVYTKPLFFRQKGLVSSHDGQTLYHFAVRGAHNVERLHTFLSEHKFHFRDGVEVDFIRWGRRRTAYVFPWEERITDQLLYQTLNQFFHEQLSGQSY